MKRTTGVDLPYFDVLLKQLDSNEKPADDALGLHVHWCYWDNPTQPDLSGPGIRKAADELTLQLFNQAKLKDGQRILDVGCGFGGAISMLNARHSLTDLVGVNIDGRQLEVARSHVQARATNSVKFVEASACELPFENRSFDTVFAVECIFHFPSKETFIREALRVLKPGGRLVFSDFVIYGPTVALLLPLALWYGRAMTQVYGANQEAAFTRLHYKILAKKLNFPIVAIRDITRNTMPTYRALGDLWGNEQQSQPENRTWVRQFKRSNRFLWLCALLRFIRYTVICYERPA